MAAIRDGALRNALAIGFTVALSAGAAPAQLCSGDCDGSSEVSVGELMTGIGIALDQAPASACSAADLDLSGSVDVSEVVASIDAALGLQCLPAFPNAPLGTVSIDVGVAAGTAGATVSFPVTLDSGGLLVAGIQNDIAFDPLTPVAATGGGQPDCTANPATGKSVFAAFHPTGCTPGATCTSIRVLMLSLSDLSPIPDGQLYTCNVAISPGAAADTYPLLNSNLGSSDPVGNAQLVNGADGAVIVFAADDADGDGVVDAVDNCVNDANSDQSDVDGDGAGDVCDADDTPTSLVLSVARLRLSPPGAARGTLKLRALVNDNDSSGSLEANALASGVTVSVVAPLSGFNASWTFPPCRRIGSGRIECRSSDRTRRASFQPSGQGPFLYKLRVAASKLSPLDTGSSTLAGPVNVAVRHGVLDRLDSIATCAPSRATGLSCIER